MKKHIFLLIIPLIIVIIWFHQGKVLGWSEEGIPFYNATKMWSLSNSLWMPIETGIFAIDFYPRINLAWLFMTLSYFYVPAFLFQAILIYGLMIVGMYSIYYLTKHFLNSYPFRDHIAFIAAIFYLLNPFSMIQIWQRGLYAQNFMFSLLPLSLLLFVLGLDKKKLIYSPLLVLISFIFSTAFGLVTNIIVFWSVLSFYFLFRILQDIKVKEIVWKLCFFVITFLLWVLIHAWWFLPLVLFSQDIFGGKAGQVSGNISTLYGVSQYFTFPTIIRLTQDFYLSNPGFYGKIYISQFFQLISWIAPFCLSVVIFKAKQRKSLLFFVFLLIISFAFCLGSNPPFGILFVKLFTLSSVLQSFRNPYEKYGIVFMLAYAPLFAYGLYIISDFIQRILKKFIKISVVPIYLMFLVLTSGIYLWPMWGNTYKPAINLPPEYTMINSWLKMHEKNNNFRIFIIPFLGEGINNDWGYSGLESTLFTISKPSLSYMLQTIYTNDIFHNLYNYMGQVNEFPVLSLLDAKYFLTRKDVVNVDMRQLIDINTALEPNTDSAGQSFCIDQSHETSVVCSIPLEIASQMRNIYIDISFKTDIPSNISIQLKNKGGKLVEWSDNGNTEFTTQANSIKKLLFPLGENITINMDDKVFAPQLIIQATSIAPDKIPTISVQGVRFVPFLKQTLKEKKLIISKGKLALFELDNNQLQQSMTTLWTVKEESTFRDFFTQAEVDRDMLARTGYVIRGQNSKDINKFININSKNTLRSRELSSTRYFVQTASPQATILAFNQTFNPLWKVVYLKNYDALQYSLLNDIYLVRSTFLPEDNHIVGNGYANFWYLPEKKDGYGVIFLPQIYSDIGAYISASSAGLILFFIIFFKMKKSLGKEQ